MPNNHSKRDRRNEQEIKDNVKKFRRENGETLHYDKNGNINTDAFLKRCEARISKDTTEVGYVFHAIIDLPPKVVGCR